MKSYVGKREFYISRARELRLRLCFGSLAFAAKARAAGCILVLLIHWWLLRPGKRAPIQTNAIWFLLSWLPVPCRRNSVNATDASQSGKALELRKEQHIRNTLR